MQGNRHERKRQPEHEGQPKLAYSKAISPEPNRSKWQIRGTCFELAVGGGVGKATFTIDIVGATHTRNAERSEEDPRGRVCADDQVRSRP